MKKKFTLLLISLFIIATKLFSQDNVTDSLVFYYSFTKAGTNNNSINVIDTTNKFGEDSTAGYFTGSSYINFGDTIDLDSTDFSISVWVYTDFIQGGAGSKILNKGLTSYGTPPSRGYGIRVIESLGTKYLRFYINGDGSYITTESLFNENEWANIICSKNDSVLSLYINGELMDTTHYIGNLDLNTNIPLAVGALYRGQYGNTEEYFKGTLDELRIYRKELNKDEIFTLYREFRANEGLLRYYNLDNNLEDTSGNNIDATAHDSTFAHRNGVANACYSTGKTSTSSIDVPSIGNWGNHLAISFWFYGNAAEGAQAIMGSRQNGSGATLTNIGCILQPDSILRFFIASDAPDEPNTYSSEKIKPYDWNHVVLIQNREISRNIIILNGVADTVTYKQTPRYLNYTIGFGGWNSGFSSTGGFTGRIDDIRIYNRELSIEEVNYLHSQEFDVETENDILAEYDFVGDAEDITGNGYNGTVEGAELATDRFNNRGNAFYFNSSEIDYIDLGNNLKPDNFPIFVSIWVNHENISGEQVIFRNDDWDTTSILSGVIVKSIDGRISAAYGNATGNTENDYYEKKISNTLLESNIWYHIVAGFLDPEKIAIFINNEEISGIYSGTITELGYQSENGAFGIGTNETSKFSGKIDDIRVYNRYLDPLEIQDIYTTIDKYFPKLQISTTEINFNEVTIGRISEEKSFEVSGNYLDGNLEILAPEGFEVSATSGNNFDTLLILTPEYATLNTTTVYARFTPANTYTYSGTIRLSSTNLSEMIINVSGLGITTGIDDYQNSKISIYPNPSNGNINIKLPAKELNMIKVFDICGRIVFDKSFKNTDGILHLNLNQKPGLYFIEIINEENKFVNKIIIK